MTESVVERLTAHSRLGSAPRAELEWLAAHGTLLTLAAGDVFLGPGMPPRQMAIMFSGHWAIFIDRGAGPRRTLEWRGGDVAGVMPFSRMKESPGEVRALEATEVLTLERDCFPDLVRNCPEVTGILVHAMLDRARLFTSSEQHDEKLVSIGRLAAGLAHELNNPASAASRDAKQMGACLDDLIAASRGLGTLSLTREQDAVLDALAAELRMDHTPQFASVMDRADREDTLADWLSAHALDAAPAACLVDSALDAGRLEKLAASFHGAALKVVVHWVAAVLTARSLASGIGVATERMTQLVGAVKSFTYMDRAPSLERVDFKRGIGDTLAMLSSKIRDKKADVTLTIEHAVPQVFANGGELNQVWMNLIDNALDAIPVGGQIVVIVAPDGPRVSVRVCDEGPGIPADIMSRVFDPFFTTKPMGQGTGLGLDIARRLVRQVGGDIEVESRPGRTEFRVSLPVAVVAA